MNMNSITNMTWKTSFTTKFQCRLPLMAPPMIGVSGGVWNAAVHKAGALGFLAAGHLGDVESVKKEIALYRKLTQKNDTTTSKRPPLSLGFIGHSATSSSSIEQWTKYEQLLQDEQPSFVQFFAPAITRHPTTGQTNVQMAQDYGALVMAQVGNYQSAVEALEAGVDALIVQGSEAGGHGLRPPLGRGLLPLLADVKSIAPAETPVLAGGGISTGQTAAAVLCAGADGVVIGTRLWASKEALGNTASKQAMVDAVSCDAAIRTTVVDQIQNHYTPFPWPQPYDSLGVLQNKVTETWEGKSEELSQVLGSDVCPSVAYRIACRDGDVTNGSVLSGQGVGQINAIDSVETIVATIAKEMEDTIRNLPSHLLVDE
jgi:nitronate monooxygenase